MSVAELLDTMEYGPAPETAAAALAWIKERGAKLGLFINGEFRPPAEPNYFDTINPATSKTLAQIAQAGKADIDTAVQAAREAQSARSQIGGHARPRYL